MNEVLARIGEIGVIPVVKIEKATDAVNLGRALMAGDLPLAEITFRTSAAEEAIRHLSRELPELLVGAGTVLSTEQVDRALDAGARFIVSPGFNPRVVDHCLKRGIPVTPGISSPSDIEAAIERGLEILKFFPAGASGGIEFLKAIAAPYAGVKFIPTGGVDPSNAGDYLAFDRVHAVGGTWIAREAAISAGKFEEISGLAREAVSICLGFQFAHLGMSRESADEAASEARRLLTLFGFPMKDGASSIFCTPAIEITKARSLGVHGHLAISTRSIPRALAYLARKGVSARPETRKEKDGKLVAVYLDQDVAGFAVHLLQA